MMPDSLWTSETDAGVEPQAEQEQVEELEPEIVEEPHLEAQEEAAPVPALAVSADDFSALEERVLRAVNLVKRERLARTAAEDNARQMEAKLTEHTVKLSEHAAQLGEHLAHVEQLQAEVKSLRSERDHVRQRVERLLAQLDSLEI